MLSSYSGAGLSTSFRGRSPQPGSSQLVPAPKRCLRPCKHVTHAYESYQGRYGIWSIEPSDVQEVTLYRVGITVATTCTILASAPALLPGALGDAAQQAITPWLDPIVLTGSLGLGSSLLLIHIYVDPLKKLLQALWLAGSLGCVYLMVTQDVPAAVYVAEHPWAVWLVGPLFASLTALLFGVTPLLMLGHLTNWVPLEGQKAMLGAMVAIMTVFAARKYTQPIKDDIGDKSIFTFMASTPEKQQEMLRARGLDD